jgi:hypothetical protein
LYSGVAETLNTGRIVFSSDWRRMCIPEHMAHRFDAGWGRDCEMFAVVPRLRAPI